MYCFNFYCIKNIGYARIQNVDPCLDLIARVVCTANLNEKITTDPNVVIGKLDNGLMYSKDIQQAAKLLLSTNNVVTGILRPEKAT